MQRFISRRQIGLKLEHFLIIRKFIHCTGPKGGVGMGGWGSLFFSSSVKYLKTQLEQNDILVQLSENNGLRSP